MRAIARILALLLFLTGCSQSGSGPGSFDQLVFRTTGGIAGFDRQMAMDARGAFQMADRGKLTRTGTLTGEELAQLKAKVARVPWNSLEKEYVNPRVADGLFEGVSLTRDGKTMGSTVGTEAPAPRELLDLIEYLRKLQANHMK